MIRFEEPPRSSQGRPHRDHHGIAAQLRARPGKWAIVGTYSTPAAAGAADSDIKTGMPRAYRPAGAFEAVSRTVDGEFRVYARYVGEAGEAR